MSILSAVGDVFQGVGGIVEDVVTGLTGSEALGDVAGAVVNAATGNYVGAALNAAELGRDLVESGARVDVSVAFGGVGPARTAAATCPPPERHGVHGVGGWASQAGQALPFLRMGGFWMAGLPLVRVMVQVGPSSPLSSALSEAALDRAARAFDHGTAAGAPGTAGGAGGTGPVGFGHPACGGAGGRIRDILSDPGLSLEDKVAMLLAALVDDLDGKIENKMRKMADASGEKGNDFQQLQTELQQLMQKRSQMLGLQTNLMQMFHQTSMQVIGNLR